MILTQGYQAENYPSWPRDSQRPQPQHVPHLGDGHVHGGARREAADDNIIDEEAEAPESEESHESLNEPDTEGDRCDYLQRRRLRLGRRVDEVMVRAGEERTGELGGEMTVLVVQADLRGYTDHHLE